MFDSLIRKWFLAERARHQLGGMNDNPESLIGQELFPHLQLSGLDIFAPFYPRIYSLSQPLHFPHEGGSLTYLKKSDSAQFAVLRNFPQKHQTATATPLGKIAEWTPGAQ